MNQQHHPTTLFRNARVIDPASGMDKTSDVLVESGVIRAIEPTISESDAELVIDAEDKLLTPG